MNSSSGYIQCNLSLMPLGIVDYSSIIRDCIEKLCSSPLEVTVGPMSTIIAGPEEIVFETIQNLFQYATSLHSQIVLNVTISNCCPRK